MLGCWDFGARGLSRPLGTSEPTGMGTSRTLEPKSLGTWDNQGVSLKTTPQPV